ncbi:MAG TPA: DUF2683 family protein [Bacteroidales bacterium]|nr:DUF2683 family protein [Bacteroidales bacterium]
MEVLTIHPENNEQMEAVKAVLKALKIPFVKRESLYDQDFINKVLEAEKERHQALVLNSGDDIDTYFNNLANEVQD